MDPKVLALLFAVLAVLGCSQARPLQGRALLQEPCTAVGTASASVVGNSQTAAAVQSAFSQCNQLEPSQSCDAIALTEADAIAQAVVQAVTKVSGSVTGGEGCTGVSKSTATAEGTATAIAKAFADAAAMSGCQAGTAVVQDSTQATQTVVARVLSQAACEARLSGVSDPSTAACSEQNIVQQVKPAIAKALATVLSRC